MQKASCYYCCMMLSFAGAIFLLIVGSLLLLQPMYIHGSKTPKSSATSCFEAAALYGAVLGGMFVMWKKEQIKAADSNILRESFNRDRSYYEIEDSDEELPLTLHMSPGQRTSGSQKMI